MPYWSARRANSTPRRPISARSPPSRAVCTVRPNQLLIERLRKDPAGLGLLDVAGIAADAADHHGQSTRQGFQQHNARGLLVGRVDEQIGRNQKPGDIIARAEKDNVVRHAELPGQPREGTLGAVCPRRRAKSSPAAVCGSGARARIDRSSPFVRNPEPNCSKSRSLSLRADVLAKAAANLRGLRAGNPVPRHIRRHAVKAVLRRAIVLHVLRLLDLGDDQDLRRESRPKTASSKAWYRRYRGRSR